MQIMRPKDVINFVQMVLLLITPLIDVYRSALRILLILATIINVWLHARMIPMLII